MAWPGPRRIAHRGGGTLAPENTLAGIREAIARGWRGVEFDVMLTADGVPVLMHDPRFGRTIAGNGEVAATSWDELATRDAGSWFSPRFAGERVLRYDDAVRFCVANDVWMNVEIKPSPGREAETGRVVGEASAALGDEIRAAGNDPAHALLLSSFSVSALAAARDAVAAIPRGLLFGQLPANGIDSAFALDCTSIHLARRGLRRADVQTLRDAGFASMIYTVDDVRTAGMLNAWGVDAICVDAIDTIRSVPL